MDNYSKNKINIPGFIVLLLWAGIVVAVANHNHPFASQTNSDDEILSKKIDIMNNMEPSVADKIEPQKISEAPRFRFSSDVQIITTDNHGTNKLKPYNDLFYNYKNNILNIINQELITLKSIEFDQNITTVSIAPPNSLLVFTDNGFLYTLDINDTDTPIKRVTIMPYKGIKAYSFNSNSYIINESFELISLNPQFLKNLWIKKLNSAPNLITHKENKILVFTPENNILVLDNADGKTLFEIPYAYEAKSVVQTLNDSLVIQNKDNSIVKINLDTKETTWEKKYDDLITSVKALKEHNIIIKIVKNSQLYAIDSESGEQLWNRNLEHKTHNFIFPIKVTAKEIQSFELGWRYKGEVFVSSCSKIGLCFIDPKNGRVLKIIRDFNNYDLQQYIYEPVWIEEQLTALAIGTKKTESEE